MKPIIIGVAGGTGSGKSTFTNRLKASFGDDIAIIYHDNYYRCNDGIPFEERVKINYDHPDALETDLLVRHLEALCRGESIECPVYSFPDHNRSAKVTLIKPSQVIIVEGILIFQDVRLRELFDIKIYVEADADERILRRALRDMEERGRSLSNIIDQYLTTVKPMHALFVEPTKTLADVIINSGLNDVAFDLVRTKIDSILSMEESK